MSTDIFECPTLQWCEISFFCFAKPTYQLGIFSYFNYSSKSTEKYGFNSCHHDIIFLNAFQVLQIEIQIDYLNLGFDVSENIFFISTPGSDRITLRSDPKSDKTIGSDPNPIADFFFDCFTHKRMSIGWEDFRCIY